MMNQENYYIKASAELIDVIDGIIDYILERQPPPISLLVRFEELSGHKFSLEILQFIS